MDKISIVMPLYNCERFVSGCIKSLLNQTYSNIELVVVNDCTPDNAINIVKEFASKDERIKIIENQRNVGPMISRYTGCMNSTGTYITFCDSDDQLPPNAIQILYEGIVSKQADIVSGNITYLYSDGAKKKMDYSLKYGCDKISVFKSLLRGEYGHQLCAKIFTKHILMDYNYEMFENFTNGEDGYWFYNIVNNSRTICHIDEVVYLYNENLISSSHKKLSERAIQSIVALNAERVRICGAYSVLYQDLFKCVSRILVKYYFLGYDSDGVLSKHIRNYNLQVFINPFNIIKYNQWYKGLVILIKLMISKQKG